MKSEKISQSYDIEKGSKYNVGDPKPGQPDILWTDLGNGKFDWKSKNGKWWKGKSIPTTATAQSQPKQTDNAASKTGNNKTLEVKDIKSLTPDKLVEYAKNASTDKLEKVVNDKNADKSLRQIAFNELKGRDDYDKTKVDSKDLAGGYVAKPTAKVQYNTKKPEVELPDLEDYVIFHPTRGKLDVRISSLRNMMANYTDDKLLDELNNHQGNYQRRQVAYEEAAARGIDEDKIDVKGTLLSYWKKEKDKKEIADGMTSGYNEANAVSLTWDALPADHAEIMEKVFEGGDDSSWLDKNSKGVKKAFQIDTKSGRKRYDAFKDYYQRQPEYCPAYLNAENKINNLAGDLLNWAKADKSPMFISSGGAGAGKTFTWQKKIAPYLNLPQLQPGADPSDSDWGYVMLKDNDILDEKNFRKVLAKYNGGYIDDNGNERPHVLFFDDADKMLVTGSEPYKNLLKAICDNDPNNRIFTNPQTGQKEVWKGKIVITTNKDITALSKSEDFKAIQSRVAINDIQFTKNEVKELLTSNNRYQKMELPGTAQSTADEQGWSKDEEKQFREDVLDYLFENMDMADPNKITPRIYSTLMDKIAPAWRTGTSVVDLGNGQAGANIHWRLACLDLLKAESNDIEKGGTDDYYSKNAMIERKAELDKMLASSKYKKVLNEDTVLTFLSGSEDEEDEEEEEKPAKKSSKKTTKAKKVAKVTDEETKKSFDNEMSLDEAEQILFS